jgi:serine O-acetyltransferase
MISIIQAKDRLPLLTEGIVETYTEIGGTVRLGRCPMPTYNIVVSIIDDLKSVLFPGYRRRDSLRLSNLIYHVGNLVDTLYDRLTQQIARALNYEATKVQADDMQLDRDWDVVAQAKTLDFLEKVSGIRKELSLDAQAAYSGDPSCRSLDEVIYCYPGFEAVIVYRLAHLLHEMGIPLIPRMMTEWAHSKTGIDIHPGAKIGSHFFINHGTGVVIGETCEIGEWVKIYQGVTLGALSATIDAEDHPLRGAKRHPTVEDRVVVYANATVLGGQTVIGHDSVLGSNVWITSSIAPHTIVSLEKPNLRMRTSQSHDFASDWSI